MVAKNNKEIPDYKTVAGAWEIAQKFADTEAKSAKSLYCFDSSLPYKKDIIALALLNLLTSNDFKNLLLSKGEAGEKMLSTISNLMFSLTTIYIPDKEDYKKIIELNNFTTEIGNIGNLNDKNLLKKLKKATV
jgi:hypothetical protein